MSRLSDYEYRGFKVVFPLSTTGQVAVVGPNGKKITYQDIESEIGMSLLHAGFHEECRGEAIAKALRFVQQLWLNEATHAQGKVAEFDEFITEVEK